MRKLITSLTCQLTIFIIASISGAQNFRLEYKILQNDTLPKQYSGAETLAKKPPEIKMEPEYSNIPLYAKFSFGPNGKENPYIIVLDDANITDDYYDILYIDKDRDGNILEEKPILRGKSSFFQFELEVNVGNMAVNHQLEAVLYQVNKNDFKAKFQKEKDKEKPRSTSSENSLELWIRERGTWKGSIVLSDEKFEITLLDRNVNGIYNDQFKFWSKTGKIKTAGDGFCTQLNNIPLQEVLAFHGCPTIFYVGGKLYDAKIASNGSSISFSPVKGNCGYIVTKTRDLKLIVATDGGKFINAKSKNHKIHVPVGDAKVFLYSEQKVDSTGTEWAIIGFLYSLEKLLIEKGKGTPFRGGPPVTSKLTPDKGAQLYAGSLVKLMPELKDSAGFDVLIEPLEIVKGQIKHSFIVIKQGERVLLKDKIEEESGVFCPYTWHIPKNLSGIVTAIAEIYAGPFKLEKEPLVLEIANSNVSSGK